MSPTIPSPAPLGRRSRAVRALASALLGLATPAALAAQRVCATARTPGPLPMAMQLVDSAALAAALPARVLPATTFSLWYGTNGVVTHVLALADSLVVRDRAPVDSETRLRADIATAIAGVAFSLDSGRSATVRLTVGRESVGAISLAVERSVTCSPVERPVPHPPIQREVLSRDDLDELRRAGTVGANVTVDAAGQARDVAIVESSGSRVFDDQVRHDLASTRYEPATVDGFPEVVTIHVRTSPPRFAP